MLGSPESRTAALTPATFVQKWGPDGSAYRLNERAGAQPHFMELCQVLDVQPPDNPETYCFERGFKGIHGGHRFADVWKRGCFAWEYKAPGHNLGEALDQLMRYALPLENPPLLVVSDRLRFEIHTHFTGHPSKCTSIENDELRDPQVLDHLRAVFNDPYRFKPDQDIRAITENAAKAFAGMADKLRRSGVQPLPAAHFLTQCVFCFFAEDAGILPGRVFKRLVEKKTTPDALRRGLAKLFTVMGEGGDFGADDIPWFNGGLFNDVAVPALDTVDVETLAHAATMDWRAIDPSIFGTLFERGLDPSKRSQLGAHYTDPTTIMRLVDPVVRRPLLDEWDVVKRSIAGHLGHRDYLRARAKGIPSKAKSLRDRFARLRTEANKEERQAAGLFAQFLERLKNFRVLDPACGSGNFLFLALKALKDLEHQANLDAEELGLQRQLPVTGPHNLLGIEVNEYAAELARTTIWIGELQWRRQHGYGWKTNPILDPLDQIECRDALLNASGDRSEWPMASVVIGNPPFVGNKKMREALSDGYAVSLRHAYAGDVSDGADLVCYWFEKARAAIEQRGLGAAGLVATNSIRQGASREVLDRIGGTTRIFDAWTDEPWVNDGAAVRVSLVCFGRSEGPARLNGVAATTIPADLSGHGNDLTIAFPLRANGGTAFQGTSKVGRFDIDGSIARRWLSQPNASGRPNADVVKPWVNGQDVTRRGSDTWIVDFGATMDERTASMYELPFEWVTTSVRPERMSNNRIAYRTYWWRHAEPRAGLRRALVQLERFIATARVAKHRCFVWVASTTLPDTATVCIARSDDVTFGCLQTRLHTVWARQLGSSLEDRPRYTPTSCFETFPFPSGLTPADTGHQRIEVLTDGAVLPADLLPSARSHGLAIARAAKTLNDLRERWLNPTEWTARMPEVVPVGMSTSPYADRFVCKLGHESDLAKRTLTNLYNARPIWLARAHDALDAAVAAAYGWTDYSPTMPDEEILRRLLAENLQRAHRQPGAQVVMPLLGAVSSRKGSKRSEPAAPEGARERAPRRSKLQA